jgi:hypothetical protein
MQLPLPVNVIVDIHRSANPSSPYTLGPLAAAGVRGHLRPAVANGRLGSAQWLRWTHLLYLEATVDIRDAYNTQLDPARDDTRADLVLVTDSTTPTTRTAFYVVFVEAASRGTTARHLRVYLDRFQPSAWPTDAL